MSTGHTPGPWVGQDSNGRFMDTEWSADNTECGVTSFAPITANGNTIALVVLESWDDELLEANARIIAASPDLLEVLQDVLADCASIDTDSCLSPDVGRKVIAAIVRATGESS